MNHRDIAVLMDGIAPVLRGYVEKAFEPIGARMLALEQRFNDLPAPRDGKDADPVLILRLVEEAVSKIPPVQPEKIDPAAVENVVAEKVATAFAALPPVEPGKDADPELVLRLVRETIAAHPAPAGADGKDADPALVAELVERAVASLPPAKDGEAGPAGESITVEQLAPLVAETVARQVEKLVLPTGPAGEKGEQGSPGVAVTVEDLAPVVAEAVAKATVELQEIAANLPAGKDGAPGPVGEPGESITVEELAPVIEDIVLRRVGEIPPAKDGLVGKEGSPGRDGRDGLPGVQGEKGIDGRHGVDGKNGFGIDDFDVKAVDDGRSLELSLKRDGSDPIIKHIDLATVLDRGVWREQGYAKGDGVTWGGSFFIAQRLTGEADKPGNSNGWRLSVKKGRDGKDGRDGKSGLNGKDGRDGKGWA